MTEGARQDHVASSSGHESSIYHNKARVAAGLRARRWPKEVPTCLSRAALLAQPRVSKVSGALQRHNLAPTDTPA
jgi:hypothetical protein